MKTPRMILSSIALVLALAACAPAVSGGFGNPVSLGLLETAKLQPGQTQYVAQKYPDSYFKFDEKSLDNTLTVDFKDKDISGNVKSIQRSITWVKVLRVDGPEGWKLEVAAIDGLREITNTTTNATSVQVRFYDYYRLVYKITAPEKPSTDLAIFKVTLADNQGTTGTAMVMAEVKRHDEKQ